MDNAHLKNEKSLLLRMSRIDVTFVTFTMRALKYQSLYVLNVRLSYSLFRGNFMSCLRALILHLMTTFFQDADSGYYTCTLYTHTTRTELAGTQEV